MFTSLFCLICLVATGPAAIQPAEIRAPVPLFESGRLDGDAGEAPVAATMTVRAGHAVELNLEGSNLLLEITDSAGETVRRQEKWDFPCEGLTPLRLLWVAPKSEELRVALSRLGDHAPAPYRLHWTRHQPAADLDREWDRAQSLVRQAAGALEAGDGETAGRLGREAAEILTSRFDDPTAFRSMEALANLFWVSDWEFSRSLLRSAAEGRRIKQGAEHPCLADTLSLTAILFKDHGVWDEALDAERRALEIRRNTLGADHLDVGVSLFNLGVILWEQARLQESEESFRSALQIFQATPEMQDQVPTVLYSLGEVLRQQNRSSEAGELFKSALDLAQRRMAPNDPVLPRIMNSLAGHFADRGELRMAEEWHRRSLRLKREGDADPGGIANSLLNVADILRRQARYEEAEPLYLEALREARGWMAASSPELVWFLNAAAEFYRETSRPQRALELLAEAVDLLQSQPEHPLLAQVLHDLAELQLQEGDSATARRNAGQALKIREEAFGADHPDVAATLVLLARIGEDGREADTRAALLDRALGILEGVPVYPDVQMEALALRARVRRSQGRSNEAIGDLVRGLQILEDLRGLRGGGDLSRAALLAERLEDFQLLARWYFQDGRPADAIEALERHRGRVFLDRVRLAGVDLAASIPAAELGPLREEENQLRARIAGDQQRIQRLLQGRGEQTEVQRLSQDLKETLQAYRQLQERIRDASPIWRDRFSRSTKTASLEEIQTRLLGSRELMLIYQVGAESSLVALVPPGEGPVRVFDLTIGPEDAATLGLPAGPLTAAALEQVLVGRGPASILGQLGDPQAALAEVEGFAGYDSKPMLQRLHSLWRILAPPEAWSRLSQAEGVVVLPDAALHQLPFEALVVSAGENSRDSVFWLDRGPAVRYAPSASVLGLLRLRAAERRASDAEPSILSVSNPTYSLGSQPATSQPVARGPEGEIRTRYLGSGGELEPLPGTARETEALVRAFGPRRVQILEAAQATETRVREALPGKRFVHLATHGFVGEGESDLLASLALTPPPADATRAEDDGFLQLFEIYQLKLDSELTALSACETNLGRRVAGEGVFALSSGFLVAGSSRVLASQWRVDDESSAWLIGAYFEKIAESEKRGGAVDFARALSDAKKKLRERPRNAPPYFWAPFVLAGLN